MEFLWRTETEEWSKTPIVLGNDLIVKGGDSFEGLENCYTARIDMESGDCVEKLGYLSSTDACAKDGKLYVASFHKGVGEGTHIACYKLTELANEWKVGDEKFDNFSVSENYVALKHLDGTVMCRSARNGELLWKIGPLDAGVFHDQYEIDNLPRDVHSEYVVKRMRYTVGYPCIYSDKVIVTPMYGNNIIGLDAKTGQTLWVAHLEYTMCTRLQAYGDEIYSSGGRYIEAHSMATGERTKLIEVDQDSYANATGERSPAMSDFTLSETHVFGFKTSPDPIFYSVNKSDGAVEWAYKPDKPIRDADHPYICNGRIYYRTLGGAVYF